MGFHVNATVYRLRHVGLIILRLCGCRLLQRGRQRAFRRGGGGRPAGADAGGGGEGKEGWQRIRVESALGQHATRTHYSLSTFFNGPMFFFVIAGCPSRLNDEWFCEKYAIIPYMAVQFSSTSMRCVIEDVFAFLSIFTQCTVSMTPVDYHALARRQLEHIRYSAGEWASNYQAKPGQSRLI